jgi:bifunctional ADP-heptose synthase (sugar kinase/adenylyltransferase)
LVSNGTASAPSWQTVSALTSGTFVTTSGTAVDFTGLPSGVKRITVIFNNVSTSGAANLIIQIGTSSGFITTGYGGSAGYSPNAASPVVSTNSIGFKIDNLAGAGDTRCGIASLCLLSSARWIASSVIGNSSGAFVGYGGGTVPITGTLDRVRITADGTQTFDQGTVNIFYEV